MTVLVTGARGGVARALLALLHDRGVAVRAGSRDPARLDLPAGVPAVRCALTEPDTFPAALAGIDAVFLYAEPAHLGTFAARAAAAGVAHIVLLSSSTVLDPGAADDPLARKHLDAEAALDGAAVPSTFLRPGSFATNALRWARSIIATGSVDLPYPESHTDPIHEADLAEAALAVLTDPSLRGGRHTLTGPESLSFRQQAERTAAATGRPIAVNPVGPDDWKKAMADYLPAAFADTLLDLWRSHDGVPVPTTGTVETLTGHPARTFATWAHDHAAAFRP